MLLEVAFVDVFDDLVDPVDPPVGHVELDPGPPQVEGSGHLLGGSQSGSSVHLPYYGGRFRR